MKQYLSSDQTAKLIELGFEKPCSIASVEPIYGMGGISVAKAYTIGELLSFCPPLINSTKFGTATINIFHDVINWVVGYDDVNGVMRLTTVDLELVDALCTMCRKLKEEGVI
jgi:hypothetical protein